MDLRSARSDAWRAIELAESLAQVGYAVALVHVETTSRVDLEFCNPRIGELSPEIEVYGLSPRDSDPRHLSLTMGAIFVAPQHLFDEEGRPCFREIVHRVASAAVALVDRSLSASWLARADDSLALMCGQRARWAFVGVSFDDVKGAPPNSIEAPDLLAFVSAGAREA